MLSGRIPHFIAFAGAIPTARVPGIRCLHEIEAQPAASNQEPGSRFSELQHVSPRNCNSLRQLALP